MDRVKHNSSESSVTQLTSSETRGVISSFPMKVGAACWRRTPNNPWPHISRKNILIVYFSLDHQYNMRQRLVTSALYRETRNLAMKPNILFSIRVSLTHDIDFFQIRQSLAHVPFHRPRTIARSSACGTGISVCAMCYKVQNGG